MNHNFQETLGLNTCQYYFLGKFKLIEVSLNDEMVSFFFRCLMAEMKPQLQASFILWEFHLLSFSSINISPLVGECMLLISNVDGMLEEFQSKDDMM